MNDSGLSDTKIQTLTIRITNKSTIHDCYFLYTHKQKTYLRKGEKQKVPPPPENGARMITDR